MVRLIQTEFSVAFERVYVRENVFSIYRLVHCMIMGDRWDREHALTQWDPIRLRRTMVPWNRIFNGFKTGI